MEMPPFIKNIRVNCGDSVVKMVLYSKGIIPSDKEIMLRRKKKRFSPIQMADYIAGYGIDTILFGFKININRENIFDHIKNYYGKYANSIIHQIDFKDVCSTIENPSPFLQIIEKSISIDEIISSNKLFIILLNYDFYVGRENKFRGHYILVTHTKPGYIYYHDPGPMNAGPNHFMPITILEKVWKRTCFMDDGIIQIRY